MILQKTIRRSVQVTGVGLHTGEPCRVTFRPALPGTGVVFTRRLPKREGEWQSVPADVQYVVDTRLATTLGKEEFRISTVEHCLCAMSSLRLDNVVIELEGPELPIQDGSSSFFAKALQEVGLIEQSALRRYWTVFQPIEVRHGDKWARVLPYHGLRVHIQLEFPHPAIGRQSFESDINEEVFLKDIAPARTFGFLKDIEYLRAQGLARGGSLSNAIVLDDDKVVNPEGLRWPNEFARHKALDALGDLTLLGAPLLGHLESFKAGHDLMVQLVKQIRQSPEACRLQEVGYDLSERRLSALSSWSSSR